MPSCSTLNNSVVNLSHEQIVAIYSGQITNWSQVGGNDTTIVTYTRNREYPFVSEIYACIRSDEPTDSYAHKVFDYLTTADGKKIIEASGYVTN